MTAEKIGYSWISMESYQPTVNTQVKRIPKRAVYDKTQVHEILDEAFLCHVGFVANGRPFVIPTLYARSGETIYLHGSAASRMLRTVSDGIDVCVTVTLVDGLVLARSAFHHSMNYRSVVILGKATPVTGRAEKLEALRCFTNHIVAGRWEEVRDTQEQELKATQVLALSLEEVSAKVRTGPPIDDEQDYSAPIWAGVIPVKMDLGKPEPDERMISGIAPLEIRRVIARDRSIK